MTFSLPWISGALVGALFLVSGAIEFILRRRFVKRFVDWGYPEYWPVVTSLLKISGGAMVFVPQTRVIGLVLCALISVAAIITLVRHYKKGDVPPVIINGVLLLLVGGAMP